MVSLTFDITSDVKSLPVLQKFARAMYDAWLTHRVPGVVFSWAWDTPEEEANFLGSKKKE